MFEAERFRVVEQRCGFVYAGDVWAVAGDLERLSATLVLPAAFPGGRPVDAEDVRIAKALGVPEGYAPFFCEDQPFHVDYYCCRKLGVASGPAVLVFADHAVVGEWRTVAAFIDWIDRQSETRAG